MSGGLRSADPLLRPRAPAATHADGAEIGQGNGAPAAGSGPDHEQAAVVRPADQPRWPAALPSWARAFPGLPSQVGAARRFVSTLLEGSPLRDDAVVVVSELFTNALQHSDSGRPGGLVVVQVSRWLLGVRIAVTDQGSAQCPQIRSAPDSDGLGSAAGPATALTSGVSAHNRAGDVPESAPPGGWPTDARGWPAHAGGPPAGAGDRSADAEYWPAATGDWAAATGDWPGAGGDWPADRGRGLYMVASLARQLDWHDDACGRTVHAVLGRTPPRC